MGFWKSFFGGEEENPEEEKKNAEAKTFDLMKYDGVKAMRMGQFEYAEKCFREALKIQEDLEVHDYLSQTLIRLNRLEDALSELKTIAVAEPDNVVVLLHAAHVAYMQEDYEQMKSLCEQVLAVDGENATANYMLAQAVLGQNDLINGIARLTKAISLNEQLADARLLRAKTLLKMGDVKGADEDVNWLMEHTEDEEDVLLMAARVAHAKGNDDEAIDIYNKVVEVNPFQIDAYRERGKIKYDRGDKLGAQEDMQKVLELNPEEMADVSGDYSAEGVEQIVKRAYSNMNPFGI
jgi:tetratricopeptide (TPR) repeat protein